MSVDKFLDELQFLLSDLPEEEREEALDFYRFYFNDAGEENVDAVIAELGSPEKVAYTIREGLKDKEDEGEFTESGYRPFDDIKAPATRDAHKESSADAYEYGAADDAGKQMSDKDRHEKRNAKKAKKRDDKKEAKAQTAQQKQKKQQTRKHRNPVAAVFLAILKALMVIGAICIVILLICVLVAIVIALISSIIITVAFLVSGIGLLAGGAGLVGVAMIGLTFIAFAVFLLLLAALVAFCRNGLAGGIRGITSLTGDVVHETKRTKKAKEA